MCTIRNKLDPFEFACRFIGAICGFGLIVLFVICALGVRTFAADTGLSPALDGRDDRSDDHSSVSPSTDTDIPEGLNDEISNMDSPVILLEHGTVVMASELESNQALGSAAAEADPVGFCIEVSSSIGSQLLVPSDYVERSFAVDASGNLIGIRSSTIQCYIGDFTVRFPSYGQPQYRLTNGSSYNWTDIDITYVSTSNVEVMDAHLNWWGDPFRTLIAVTGVCFLIILAFRRHD